MYPYRWGLNDGDSLDNLLLVGLGSWAVKITDDGGHAGLVTHGSSEVDLLLGVILWEAVEKTSSARFQATRHIEGAVYSRLDTSAVLGSTLPWKVSQGTVARSCWCC